jgi:hypothetical protein
METAEPSSRRARDFGGVYGSERNRLLRELRRLKLAAADMELVAGAAEMLVDDRYSPAPRVIETGLVVVYARSFKSSGRGSFRFKEQWTPPDPAELALHNSILKYFLREHRDQLDALAHRLMEHETLDEADAYAAAAIDHADDESAPRSLEERNRS